jgi:hypothetical protein
VVGLPGELGHRGAEERRKKVCHGGNAARAEVMLSFFVPIFYL